MLVRTNVLDEHDQPLLQVRTWIDPSQVLRVAKAKEVSVCKQNLARLRMAIPVSALDVVKVMKEQALGAPIDQAVTAMVAAAWLCEALGQGSPDEQLTQGELEFTIHTDGRVSYRRTWRS